MNNNLSLVELLSTFLQFKLWEPLSLQGKKATIQALPGAGPGGAEAKKNLGTMAFYCLEMSFS